MVEDIVSRLIDLDSRAESIHKKAAADVKAIEDETETRRKAALEELAQRTRKGTAEIEAKEAEKRKARVAEIDAEYRAAVQAVQSIKSDAIDKAADKVVSQAKGSPK